jgi:hypothetical protein
VAGFDSAEEFYAGSLVRAFNRKESRCEITDTLRASLPIGRIGFAPDAFGATPARASVSDYATLSGN